MTRISQSLLVFTAMAVAIVGAVEVFGTDRTMSPVWYGPYLSSALNAEWGGEFRVNLGEVVAFREMSPLQQENYRFARTDELQPYNHNPLGFTYAVIAAKAMFPALPDARAIEAFQLLVHVVLSLSVIALLRLRSHRVLFLLCYAVNPVVIHFVTLPYYYFYQALPSLGIAALLLRRDRWREAVPTWLIVAFGALCAALAITFLMRPTTIAAIALFFGLAWTVQRKWLVIAGFTLFATVVGTGYVASEKNFWHTAYVGVGAYPNAHVQGLSDDKGYELYHDRTGVVLNASLGGNYYEHDVIARYGEITRREYLRILQDDWPRLLRNAAVNFLQGFSIGYMSGQPPWVQYAIAGSGAVFLMLLLATRQFWLAAALAVTCATFTPYYPPIPAYMYGAYLLLVLGLIGIVQRFLPVIGEGGRPESQPPDALTV